MKNNNDPFCPYCVRGPGTMCHKGMPYTAYGTNVEGLCQYCRAWDHNLNWCVRLHPHIEISNRDLGDWKDKFLVEVSKP